MTNTDNVHCGNHASLLDSHEGNRAFREKVEVLRSLEKIPFDCSLIPRYLDYASDLGIAKHILKRVVKKLVEIDAHICAFHDVLPEDEWESACVASDAPDDTVGDADLRSKLSILNSNFVGVYESLRRLKIETALDVLSPIFKVRTRNVQFLLFLLAKDFPAQVFGFLISKLKRDPKVFGPFFCSLLVRLDFDAELKQKCVHALHRYFGTLRPSKTVGYLILAQSMLYILCFKEFPLSGSSVLVKRLFEEESVPLMNKNIVQKFCEIHGQKAPVMHSLKNECLYLFPFDLPVSRPIAELVEKHFVVFR